MSRRRVVAIFRRVAAEIRRDRPSLALLFIAPILITGLVTFILRDSQAPQVTAIVVNMAGVRGQLDTVQTENRTLRASYEQIAAQLTDANRRLAAAQAAIEEASGARLEK